MSGGTEDGCQQPASATKPAYLDPLTPAARFIQFAQDFRRLAHVAFAFDQADANSVRLQLNDAMEFMTKFSYTDSWLSECHERFCSLAWQDWLSLLRSIGFEIDQRSGPWRNEWLVDNVFRPTGELTALDGGAIQWPATHVFLVAIRPLTEA